MSGAAHATARFRALDGWRGICALVVALHHLELWCFLFWQPLVREAWLFVDFFFVLSGFVLAHTYGDKLRDAAGIRSFVLRRFGRLWPLHAAVLLALIGLECVRLAMMHHLHGVAARPAFTGPNSVFAIFTNLALVQALGLHDALTWNGPSWSISTEFYTYLVFALICAVAPSRGLRVVLAAAAALLGAGVLARYSPLGMEETVRWGEWRCLFGFFTGVLAYEVWRRGWLGRLRGSLAEFAVVALVVAFITFEGRNGAVVYLAPPLFALAVLVFAAEGGVLSAALTTRPAAALGRWSYSIYMVHTLVLALLFSGLSVLDARLHRDWVVHHGGGLVIDMGSEAANNLAMLAYLAAVVALAAFTWRVIERPGQALFKGWGGAKRPEIPA
ncbi:MAG: acyltransferase [Rhizomicrobium sp.]